MNFQGIVKVVTPKMTVGQKDTPKVSIVVEEIKDKYPESVLIDWMGDDKVALVEHLAVGSEVAVVYNSKVTEYNDRHYQNNGGRKLEVLSEPAEETDVPF
jgi:hypothetical protein